MQSLPFSRLAGRIASEVLRNRQTGAGSVLGGLGDLTMGE